jgi:hypothetical protein
LLAYAIKDGAALWQESPKDLTEVVSKSEQVCAKEKRSMLSHAAL